VVTAVQDRPTAAELVEAVREFLADDVAPTLDGRLAFHMRVALNVLGIVARELELGPGFDADQHARLVALLGHDDETVVLERELAAAIRAGTFDYDSTDVLAHVRATVREKLLVTNPKYLEA
jgi:hypothetical protein